MRSEDIAGVRVDFDISYEDVLAKVDEFVKSSSSHFIWTVNPEYVMRAQQDTEFRNLLNKSSVSTPDGVGLLMADKYSRGIQDIKRDALFPFRAFIYGTKMGLSILFNRDKVSPRVTGADLVRRLCGKASKKGLTVLFIGGWEKDFFGRMKKHHGDVAPRAAEALKEMYPELKLIGASSEFDYQAEYDSDALEYIHKQMSNFGVDSIDIVFVAYGPKKQEKWLVRNIDKIPAKIGIGIGAALDFTIGKPGTPRRSPEFLRKGNLEWLYRLFTQPWRIGRILKAFPVFPLFVYYLSVTNHRR